MDPISRRVRGLLYLLSDIGAGLRKEGRGETALNVGGMGKRFALLSPRECVEESRQLLEGVLLGERNLPPDLIGLILDAVGAADEILREFP